jgi:hypothetical protein
MLVSSEVVSLFTKVPLEDTLQLLSHHFHNQTIALIRQVLTTTYILYNGSFYDQRDGVTMGSPLTPVIANFYMEFFEQQAINLATKKPAHWYRYADDTFVVWAHGKQELRVFLQHLNSIHPNIKFTLEVEQNHALPLLDVSVSRRLDSSFCLLYIGSPHTHTDLYLQARSEPHSSQKQAALKTLIHWARTVCDAENLDEEINHLKKTFRQNGYRSHLEHKEALIPKQRPQRHKKKPANVAIIPFQQAVLYKISRLLAKHAIKTIRIPMTAARSMWDILAETSRRYAENI